MAERETLTHSFSRRLGYTHYNVNVTCHPNAKVTYEDRLLELIRSMPLANHHLPGELHEDQ